MICAAARPWGNLSPDGPTGVAACIVDVVDCRPVRPGDEALACLPDGMSLPAGFAWVLVNARPVEPVPVSGMLGIFSLPDALMSRLAAGA